MKQNHDTPLRLAIVVSLLTFFLSLVLCWMIPGLPELFWRTLWEGEGPVLPCLLLSLLVGLLIWLNLTLVRMRSSYGEMITDLKARIQALEETRDTETKD